MGTIFSAITGGPLKDIIGGIGSIIDNLNTSDAEKLKAKQDLIALERDFQTKVMSVDLDYAKTQASVIIAETNSKNFLASSWRPILMLVFTYIILHNYVLATMFHLTTVPIPSDMWDLLKLGIGGYVIGRSAEKMAVPISEAFAGKAKT